MNWKEAALAHAKDQDPKEAVGLLLNVKGKERYYPCQNLAITKHQEFIHASVWYIRALCQCLVQNSIVPVSGTKQQDLCILQCLVQNIENLYTPMSGT